MKRYTRRSFLKRSFRFTVTTLFLSSVGYLYAKYMEPKMLTVNEVEIKSPLIPQSFDGIRILQFCDTHIGFHYDLNDFKKLTIKINELKPDVVLFTGDLVDAPNTFAGLNEIEPLLQTIKAPLGKYAIYGNHDHGGYGSEPIKALLEAGGFNMLVNQYVILSKEDAKIAIAGTDDWMLGKPDIQASLAGVPDNTYTILMMHEPDPVVQAAEYPVHLQVSGHSHGGQVQVPFYGPLITPPYATQFVEGLYQIKELQLYVNRGIGTTRLPYRFLATPELTVFTLKSLSQE